MEIWKIVIVLITIFIVCAVLTSKRWLKWAQTIVRVVGDVNPETFDAIVQKISVTGSIIQVHYMERSSSISNVIIFDLYCFKWNRKKLIQKFKTIPNVEVL